MPFSRQDGVSRRSRLAAFVLVIRVLSMGWSVIQALGFPVCTEMSDNLGTEFGLVTRVMATIPLRRIRPMTVRESPLHRAIQGRVNSRSTRQGATVRSRGMRAERESFGTIIRRAGPAPRVLAEVLPGVDVAA